MGSRPFSTLVELLRWRATQQPDQRAYTFLLDGETEGQSWTYSELDRQARAIGALLQRYRARGERVLLLYPPGLEFIAAFFGCLYASAIAVPAYPPRNRRHLPRIQAIVEDAQASLLLTVEKTLSKIQTWLDQRSALAAMQLLVTDNLTPGLAEKWEMPPISGQDLAFLQYTSGSTARPKGVMVSHCNLLHNLHLIHTYFEAGPESRGVIWLPPYHDMGLIGGILAPLFGGFPVVLMAPTAFLQRPLRWLQAISTYRATISGGPNFAYQLCASKITPEQRAQLDLSSWNLAFNGSEPIRSETLEQFAEAFAPSGFQKNAFYPCYGLAEATLFVTGGKRAAPPIVRNFLADEIAHHRVVEAAATAEHIQTFVGCGHSLDEQRLLIVNPDTTTPCAPNEIGEIWIAGPGVTQGYWNQPELTRRTFQATLAATNDGPFLRTGDLGLLHENELFITGRLKDLLIIRGRNHYPQDIEWTVEHCHPAIRDNSSAAFAVTLAGEERLVIVAEVERRFKPEYAAETVPIEGGKERRHPTEVDQPDLLPGFSVEMSTSSDLSHYLTLIREAVTEHHDLQVYAVLLLKATTIPRTSSGKIQRHACKLGFLEETLDVVARWIEPPIASLAPESEEEAEPVVAPAPAPATPMPSPAAPTLSPGNATRTVEEIQEWLVAKLSSRLGLRPHEIDVREPFARYGLDSVQAVNLSSELGDWLGYPLAPTLVYEYPNIVALSRYLSISTQFSGLVAHLPTLQKTDLESIAVVGLSCRFPGANNPEEFWKLLHTGGDAIREVPHDRWDVDAFYDPVPATPGKMNTRWGGFLDQVAFFDPQFFGIAPREAEHMDPQQRLLLEVAWEALESAGQVPDVLAGSYTGVFIGISNYDYSRLQRLPALNAYTGTGNALSITANRLSYFLNLRGPSLAIDTACSSSLVAVHQACQSLRRKECDMALAGGVNLILSPDMTVALSQGHFMAADGRCKTFDARADGYVRGEGCGVIVLKRLSDALRDGDNILALIRGSAVNQDGRSNGLTAPNGFAQQAVIYQALENASVTPSQISYFEAHGTGTALGDPIEVNALKEVLMSGRSAEHPCWIGSVKTNIGHLEAAAGIAGLIKVILALQHQEIPPHLHLQQLNPNISLDETPFSIPTQIQRWEVGKDRRLAGVSSFGFGGTNAHVVVEETLARARQIPGIERPTHVLTLSARTASALKELAQRYAAYFQTHPQLSLADACFTANSGRSHFEHRLALVADSLEGMHTQLTHAAAERPAAGLNIGQANGRVFRKIAFLFTGQGAQYVGMGRQLYDTQPTFRQTLDHCNELLRPFLEIPLLDVLYPNEQQSQVSNFKSQIDQTAYTQPALFALEYALAKLWMAWGVKPTAVMGHSVGEYVAACLAGVFSLEDGLKLIAERARLMQALPHNGKMAAVLTDENTVAEALAPYRQEVSIAAINGPKSVVISGKNEAIDAIVAALQAKGIHTKLLTVSHAFHSPLMEPILDHFRQFAATIPYTPPWLDVVSNVTGTTCTQELATADYWTQHIRQPVRFAAGVQTLLQQGHEIFIEVGPHPTLSGMARQIQQTTDTASQANIQWLPTLQRKQPDWQVFLQSLGVLYVHGVPVKWEAFDRDYQRRRVMLPTYPFQRQRYWIEQPDQPAALSKTASQPTTALIQQLNDGDVQGLTHLLEQSSIWTEEQRCLLPAILEKLIQRQQHELLSATVSDWFYQIDWQSKPRSTQPDLTALLAQQPGQWIILADRKGLGQALAARLRAYQHRCLVLVLGKTFIPLAQETWSINPERTENLKTLLQERLSDHSLPLHGLIHLWSLDAIQASDLSAADITQSQIIGCGSMLTLLQIMVEQKGVHTPKLWCVTTTAVPLDQQGVPHSIAQAPLWGLGRVIATEHPDIWGGLVDIDPEFSEHTCDVLLTEYLQPDGETQIALRNGQRYAIRLVAKDLFIAPKPTPTSENLTIRADATYLITGGLGALGLRVAETLIHQGARYIVLTGRHGASNETQKATLNNLEKTGAKVIVAQADVSNAEDVAKVIAHITALLPPLKGIVHAAGVLDDGALMQQTYERFRRVMAAKVEVAWNLHQASLPLELDFFVCFSSIASLLGSPGQGNYAAANAFLDALAHYRRSIGMPAMSINWGPWADIGMAAKSGEQMRERLSAQGIEMLPAAQATQIFSYLLRHPETQIGVFKVNWKQLRQSPLTPGQRLFLSECPGAAEQPPEAEQATVTQPGSLLQHVRQLPVSQRKDYIQTYLRTEIARILGMGTEQLPGVHQGFMDLGMDSIMAVEFKSHLEQDLGKTVPATVIFEYPTIQNLTEYILREFLQDQSSAPSGITIAAEGENELDNLSEADFAALLAQELETAKQRRTP